MWRCQCMKRNGFQLNNLLEDISKQRFAPNETCDFTSIWKRYNVGTTWLEGISGPGTDRQQKSTHNEISKHTSKDTSV